VPFVGALEFYRLDGEVPKSRVQSEEFTRSGIDGQGYHRVGVRGRMTRLTGSGYFDSALARSNFEVAATMMVGCMVQVIDNEGIVWNLIKVRDIESVEKFQAIGWPGGAWFMRVTFQLQACATAY
jgi:hypothetical protein